MWKFRQCGWFLKKLWSVGAWSEGGDRLRRWAARSPDLRRPPPERRKMKKNKMWNGFFFSFFFLFPFFILLLSCPFITNFEIIGGRFFVISNGYIWLCGAMMKLPFHPFHNFDSLNVYIYTFRKYMIHHLS